MFKLKLSWAFPTFLAFSRRAQKLSQPSAVRYDMGNRDFIINRNKVNTSVAVDIFFVALMFLRGLNIHNKHQSKYCFSHVFPISYIISCKNAR